jgi:uncharacterized protein YjiS (DUF1127 family)
MTKAANRRLIFFSGGAHARRYATAFIGWFNDIRATSRGRRELAQMNDRMLADIGLSRSHAQTEASRKFWDLK